MFHRQCLLWCGLGTFYLWSKSYTWFPCLSTKLSALRITEGCALPELMVSLKSPEQHFLLLALMPLNSPITSDYSTTSDVPTAKNQVITINEASRSIGWVSTFFLLWNESLAQVLCENADKIRWRPIRHETHVLSLTKHTFSKRPVNN